MKNGIVKLGEFCIAKGLKSTWEKARTMIETHYYCSPEIMSGQPYDLKSDIWALGILLYELMTFKMSFNAVSFPLLHIKINRGVYHPPPSYYSSEIKDLLKKCLTLDPKKRPSIDEILQLPLIKNRIINFLNEVQYNQDLYKTMAKIYKDKKKKKEIKTKQENENNKEETPDNNPTNTTNDSSKVKNEENKGTEKIGDNYKNKVSLYFNKKQKAKKIKETKPQSQINDKKISNDKLDDNNSNKSLN